MKPLKLPEIYFDTRAGSYWLKLDSARFLCLDGRNVKLHLMRAGFDIDIEDDHGLKSGDAVLVRNQIENYVDYAGPLAGHPAGLFKAPGDKRILVTSERRAIAPKAGNSERLEKFLAELLPGDQFQMFCYWLKIGLQSLTKGDFAPGQMIVLCGQGGCGKSLLQALITEMFGGRAAKPYRYMTGRTNFNSDLAGAEHLVIEDENSSSSITARREFGTAIKDWTVNREISVHGKGREALTLPFFRRLSLSVNDEPENLMILPPLDSSILDKLMLFKCAFAQMSGERSKNWQALTAGLPAFIHEVLRMPIPKALRDDRFGVKAFHNQELIEQLDAISPENRLESLIEQVLFSKKEDDQGFWRGTAEELEAALRNSAFAFAVERLLYFASACGVYLARLQAKHPNRFNKVKNRGKTLWVIKPKREQ